MTCSCKKSPSLLSRRFPSGPGRMQLSHPKDFSFPCWTTPILSGFPHRRNLNLFDHLGGPLQQLNVLSVLGILILNLFYWFSFTGKDTFILLSEVYPICSKWMLILEEVPVVIETKVLLLTPALQTIADTQSFSIFPFPSPEGLRSTLLGPSFPSLLPSELSSNFWCIVGCPIGIHIEEKLVRSKPTVLLTTFGSSICSEVAQLIPRNASRVFNDFPSLFGSSQSRINEVFHKFLCLLTVSVTNIGREEIK